MGDVLDLTKRRREQMALETLERLHRPGVTLKDKADELSLFERAELRARYPIPRGTTLEIMMRAADDERARMSARRSEPSDDERA